MQYHIFDDRNVAVSQNGIPLKFDIEQAIKLLEESGYERTDPSDSWYWKHPQSGIKQRISQSYTNRQPVTVDKVFNVLDVELSAKKQRIGTLNLEPNWEGTALFFAQGLRDHTFKQTSPAVISFIEQIRYLTQTNPEAVARIIEVLERK